MPQSKHDLAMTVLALRDQLDVYRYALALACGDEPWPQPLGAKDAPAYLCDDDAAEVLAFAQDELRHGRRPEWLDQ